MFTSGLLGLTNVLTLHLTSFGLEDHERAWFCLQIVALDFFSFDQVFSEGSASIVLLEDSITVEVIERGSAVHCISAYATWKHTMEVQSMYAGYTDGTYAAPCRVMPGPRFVQVMQVDRWFSGSDPLKSKSLLQMQFFARFH